MKTILPIAFALIQVSLAGDAAPDGEKPAPAGINLSTKQVEYTASSHAKIFGLININYLF